jgi:phenylacetate-coenzyme A ligase PaaK-like adenylate-forming protein
MIETRAPTTAPAELQARVSASLAAHLEVQIPRMSWDLERVQAHQRERVRRLLAHALTNSPFHACRLAGIDPSRFELAQLASLPVMSKTQMMACFDELLTDRRITRELVEEHLAGSSVEPHLLGDRYVCLASGGSSGLRGIFVQTLDEYAQFVASLARGAVAAIRASGTLPSAGVEIGLVGAGSAVHSSGFGAATLAGFPVRFVPAPATLPLPEIVARLNASNPLALQGYPSLLRQLAAERQAGRLRIAPRTVTSMGETLTAEDRAAITSGFQVPVTDLFVSTEGLVGRSDPGGPVLTFASDMCIVELVDERNDPVTPGNVSAKLLVTNLHNLTQPLIRYELSDRCVDHSGISENGHLRATVKGRADNAFHYGNIEVSPFAIRSVFATTPSVGEYQVVQTASGIDVLVVVDRELHEQVLAGRLRATLSNLGIPNPEVTVRRVAAIDRHPETGKTRRFIPIQ